MKSLANRIEVMPEGRMVDEPKRQKADECLEVVVPLFPLALCLPSVVIMRVGVGLWQED
jgi:hypothetical protein